LGHGLAILAALLVVVATTALWIVNLRMGPPMEGFTGGPMALSLPILLLVLTVVWVVIRSVAGLRWSALSVFLASAIAAYVLAAIWCGPVACFVPGPNRLMGWFLVGGIAIAALAHHLVLAAFSRGQSHATHT
jgi:hypothetical protein